MSAPAYVTPRAVPYIALDVAKTFRLLTPRQRLYAHHFNVAAWSGAGVCAQQLSPESLPVLKFYFTLFNSNAVDALRASSLQSGKITEDQFSMFLEYFALAYSNLGNYLSFGDSKFIPAIPREVFEAIVQSAPNAANECLAALHDPQTHLLDRIYSHDAAVLCLSFQPSGISSYYSENITTEDVTAANDFLKENKIGLENTRVWKNEDGTLRVLVASANARSAGPAQLHSSGRSFTVEYGDFAPYMKAVAAALSSAQEFTENETQTTMLKHYVSHFGSGNIEEHRDSQKEWVKDKGPIVETNIGFIETYRDPAGVRGEWEGFVAIVDKDQSAKYNSLVENAETFIKKLPWGVAFEKDVFFRPDFTSLDILGFASSGLPAGICIPNYDDIRQDFGFKNVYLGNVVSAMNFTDKLNHLTDEDWDVYKSHLLIAMSVGVGVHELLGHGTGKLLCEKEDGSLNFDKDTINPLTKSAVASWYKPGETWQSKFGGIANAYEECRAEAVALFLGVEPGILEIFGQTSAVDQQRTIRALWVNMVRAGMIGLEMYTPETKQWRQAHMRARFCILQTLLREPNSIVRLVHEGDNLTITLDSDRILTEGRASIGRLLDHLNINKATADVAAGTAYFQDLTEVDEKFVAVRETVMKLRKPRRQFVQPHTRINASGNVELLIFNGSVQGMVESFVTRHNDIPL